MKCRIAAIAVFLLSFFMAFSPVAEAQYSKPVNLGNITGGPLAVSKGGTGATSTTNALNALFTSQTGNSGRVWGTNGTTMSWVNASTAGCSGCVTTEAANISGVTIDNSSNDDGVALDTWIETHKTNQIVHFTPGVYTFKTSMVVNNAANIEFRCDPGAVFRKDATMDDHDLYEYFLKWNFSDNIRVNGCRFEGLTTDATTVEPGEQGIGCFSCHGFLVYNNYFKDIGDAAVRSTTNATDALASNSTDTWITNNIFDNIAQVTTTEAQSGTAKAGTAGYWVLNNKFYNLKWSLKYCTRATGAQGGHISGNEIWGNSASVMNRIQFVAHTASPDDDEFVNDTINPATAIGIEMCSVSDVWVTDNDIHDSFAAGISQYTNNSVNHFDYHNYHISGNSIDNVGVGIRFANNNGLDGVANNVYGIMIDHDIIKDVNNTGAQMIVVTGAGGVTSSMVDHNIMISPATTGQYTSLPGSGVTSTDNIQN